MHGVSVIDFYRFDTRRLVDDAIGELAARRREPPLTA
jgi:hypothetical protein